MNVIQPPRVPLTDSRTGHITREWYRYFLDLQTQVTGTELTEFEPTADAQVSTGTESDLAPPPSFGFDDLSFWIDNDGNLAANSDSLLATQKAVKTYVDNNGGGGMTRGKVLDAFNLPTFL